MFNPEFKPEELTDSGKNIDRRWKEWVENFELVLDFGVTDPAEGKSKKKAALLMVGGQALREIFATLTVADDTYKAAKDALTAHFSPKKNLTSDRYRFFCTKPTSPEESHDHWITRLRTKGKDCEFENMNLDEAIKLVVTPSEKLQREIIAKDMDLKIVIDSARALELRQREVRFMKNTLMYQAALEINSVSEQQFESKDRTTAPFRKDIKEQPARNKSTVEVCRYCGQQTPHRRKCKARGATCNKC